MSSNRWRSRCGFGFIAALAGVACSSPTGDGMQEGPPASTTDDGADDEEDAPTDASGMDDADGPHDTTGSHDTSGADTAADDGTGGAPELGACAQLLSCTEDLDELITPLLELYGAEGTCWAEFGEAACWQDCRALLEAHSGDCEDVPSCCECSEDAHCVGRDGGDHCVAGQCGAGLCEVYGECGADWSLPCDDDCSVEVDGMLECLWGGAGDICNVDLVDCLSGLQCGPECAAAFACANAGTQDCCEPHDEASCSDVAVATCVCEYDVTCCVQGWSESCVQYIAEAGCGACP